MYMVVSGAEESAEELLESRQTVVTPDEEHAAANQTRVDVAVIHRHDIFVSLDVLVFNVENALGGIDNHSEVSLKRLLDCLDNCKSVFQEAVNHGKTIYSIAPD